MKYDRRKLSGYLLLIGMMSLTISISTKMTAFSWMAFVCLFISLVMSGKWIKPKRK